MELAIKVPDDFYERVNKDGCMSYTDAEVVVNAFYCGVVLPKGHGRLIDGDKALRRGGYDESYIRLNTIVEADKEGNGDADSN